ncbi:uncharacterized protein MONOS_1674 [Monocercomonoides exilis]|uniref:uncharacterized protein n=1 Tax=Monocercomonoides exilis TaxID=2049356 RepID=UPI003559C31B|nr:hypothetical protein MONOS_1674 [Monocercomonoides exilis]|eukprot:MONOS_1674.1-p1 / transcript=MONOS_1674.1 / gene=MONOS_1674 / organism=Monocercomonoides_exilis_PA203 / gene_product=unspecified product / transcript_product=unspecified product / location=Mono_scaffold00031:33607-34145(-) / protein_length=163 / sequence_SO=supercontig / SO=protein_coding / is_pseudo=false
MRMDGRDGSHVRECALCGANREKHEEVFELVRRFVTEGSKVGGLLSGLVQDKEVVFTERKSKAESEGVEGIDGEESCERAKDIHFGNERKKEGGRKGKEINQSTEKEGSIGGNKEGEDKRLEERGERDGGGRRGEVKEKAEDKAEEVEMEDEDEEEGEEEVE